MIRALRDSPSSRQAVIQSFDHQDVADPDLGLDPWTFLVVHKPCAERRTLATARRREFTAPKLELALHRLFVGGSGRRDSYG